MCVINLNPPVSQDFARALHHLSPQLKVSTFPANSYLDSDELWSGIPDAASNDYVAGLFEDIKWGDAWPDDGDITELSYYLYDGESAVYASNSNLFGQELHDKERAAILSSMDAFANVTAITFDETTDKEEANISFLMMNNDDSDGYLGWANYPGTSPYGEVPG